MQPVLMLVFITAWLFILWFGSIALEATGMERSRARFQALSALTTSGFTTRESEDIVGHPRRRLIASWMMFLGSVGLILFLVLMFGLFFFGAKPDKPTSPFVYIFAALPAVALLVLFWLGVLDKLATVIVNWLKGTAYFKAELANAEIIHQAGNYSIARLTIAEKAPEVGCKIGDISLAKHDIKILAIERGDKTLAFPESKEVVQAGDNLLCYGKTEKLKVKS